MSKMVRLSDIAEKLNVSTVTVSKALAGQKGVSDELRQKIIRLADELGYRKTIRTEERQSYTIGVVAAERYLGEGQSLYWKLYQEISRRAMAAGCFAILEVITYEMEKEKILPKIAAEKKADGMILMGAFKASYAGCLGEMLRMPFLTLDTPGISDTCDSVVSNNVMGGFKMTNYLFEMGHRRIGFVGTRLATSSIDDRYLGYLRSLMVHGVECRKDWLVDDRHRDSGQIDSEEKFRLPVEMPTAFFCNCDITALKLIRKLEEQGYRVPEDVSVVGFDNYVPEQFDGIGITTYEIQAKEMAKRAVHILTHKLRNENYSTGMFMLPGRFIERDSVKRIGEPVPFL